jgi:hypothetical protein
MGEAASIANISSERSALAVSATPRRTHRTALQFVIPVKPEFG